MGSFIRIGLGIEEGESSLCGGAPRAVIPDGILKCPDPACTHPKTYLWCWGCRLAYSKPLLFNSAVGRNKRLSIQIDSDRRFESTRSGPRFRGTGDPGKIFMDTVYPPAIGARQITRIFAAKGALRQYDR